MDLSLVPTDDLIEEVRNRHINGCYLMFFKHRKGTYREDIYLDWMADGESTGTEDIIEICERVIKQCEEQIQDAMFESIEEEFGDSEEE